MKTYSANPTKTIMALSVAFLVIGLVSLSDGSVLKQLGSQPSSFDSGRHRQVAFDDFISGHISLYRDNMKEPTFSSPDFNIVHDSPGGDTGNVSTRLTSLRDIRLFTSIVNSSIDLIDRVGTMRIQMRLSPINVTGSYNLQGVASSVIIVKGNGTYSIQSGEAIWTQDASLIIDGSRHVRVTWDSPELIGYSQPNATFEGIEGIDVIGELIKGYLADIGRNIFLQVQNASQASLSGLLGNYIDNVLTTITIDEILSGSTSTTTNTPPTTPTGSTGPTSTMRPDLVVDVGSDLAESGWVIPTLLQCGYATNLNGFFCNGDPVLIRDPFPSTGFWMSPCPGRCTFTYDNVANGNSFKTLGIRAYYSDTAAGSRILVDFAHSSGTTHFEFVKDGGEYNEFDFTEYGTLRSVNITMDNVDGGHFAVLDRLSVAYN